MDFQSDICSDCITILQDGRESHQFCDADIQKDGLQTLFTNALNEFQAAQKWAAQILVWPPAHWPLSALIVGMKHLTPG